ncbi:recombination protein NinB [Candidatus Venteria ishoeyi]|uniref:NinB protein n=1 Tax=Candidatus Venteria ishoeyi TaxID=1899563 RepID=A0A1H6FBW2_9GAMM|nr:recombination protein NinB [Candidatus Venteria ishoeyi]SEH06495.1 NinB protein [Candidatus Venteria ishoeyi]
MKSLKIHVQTDKSPELSRVQSALENRPSDAVTVMSIQINVQPERNEKTTVLGVLAYNFIQVAARYCGVNIEFKRKTRNLEQNAKMWAMLGEISRQVEWDVFSNGEWIKAHLSPEDCKDMLTAWQQGQRLALGIDGGHVRLGARTSKMTVAEMAELIELIQAFGDQKGVIFRKE